MAIDGTPKFSTLSVAEISVDFKGNNVSLTCKVGFVNRETNVTHGWTRGEGAIWSKETIARLDELRAAMEIDLAARHFHEYSTVGGSTPTPPPVHIGGIGEHLSEADQA